MHARARGRAWACALRTLRCASNGSLALRKKNHRHLHKSLQISPFSPLFFGNFY
jgi:hypothetical protein